MAAKLTNKFWNSKSGRANWHTAYSGEKLRPRISAPNIICYFCALLKIENMKRILFVCLGNICRSATAHAVFRQLAAEANFHCEVESAGTSASHKGASPDPRSIKAAVVYNFKGIKQRKSSLNTYQVSSCQFIHASGTVTIQGSWKENASLRRIL